MLAVVLSSVLAFQEPAPEPNPAPPNVTPATPAPAPAVPVVAWDDKTAKTAVDEFGKQTKGTPSMAEKNQALDGLAGGSHKLLVKPLAQFIETDKSVVLRRRAAELLANQPPADANGTIRRLLKNARVGSAPTVQGELVRGLARCGYDKAQWNEVGDLFEREYHPERVPVQEAVLDLVIAHKEAQALPLLLRNLDEPVPENVDDASNPPAEYWEARWKSWSAWRGKVKDALFAVTGQRFSTAAEAKAWLKKNPVK
ncbi:MAG: HEAT repeat domain-containing protein [Planctomycetota bacterium]